jgi:hypothetical protein
MNNIISWLRENLKGDPVLWGIVISFSILSILVVYSATGTLAYKKMAGNTEYFLFKHTGLILIGLAFMWLAHKVHYRYYSKLSLVALILSVPLLIYTWKFGSNINEASRWLTIPLIKQTFQPSEAANGYRKCQADLGSYYSLVRGYLWTDRPYERINGPVAVSDLHAASFYRPGAYEVYYDAHPGRRFLRVNGPGGGAADDHSH